MSNAKTTLPGSSKPLNLRPGLSPECQKDLDDALDETPTEEDVKETWVEENRRDLLRAFATGRKVDPSPYKNIEVFSAVEGTEKDLRYTLRNIYERYGRLSMYNKGLDNLARHWVAGYQATRGQQTVQKVMLYVEGTEWTRRCQVLENLAAMIDVEDPEFPDAEGWTVVEKANGGIGFKHHGA